MGFVITVVTLIATYLQARKARSSADAAEKAAKEASGRVLRSVARIDTIRTLEAAINLCNRVYERQQKDDWDRVPEFYKDVCDLLAEVQGGASALTSDEKEDMLKAVAAFARSEERIQFQLRTKLPITPKQAAGMNKTVNRHRQRLITIKTDIGRRNEA